MYNQALFGYTKQWPFTGLKAKLWVLLRTFVLTVHILDVWLEIKYLLDTITHLKKSDLKKD